MNASKRSRLGATVLGVLGAMLVSGATFAAPLPPTADGTNALRAFVPEGNPGIRDLQTNFGNLVFHIQDMVKVNRFTTYHFKLQPTGHSRRYDQVKLKKFYGLEHIQTGQHASYSAPHTEFVGTIYSGEVKYIHVECNPPAGQYCSGAFIEATSANGHHTWGIDERDGYGAW